MPAIQQPIQQPTGGPAWANNAAAPRALITFSYGLNENPSATLDECTFGYNFDLELSRSSLIPRKPFDLAGTATNGAAISGIMQLTKRSTAQTTIVAAGDTVYQWNGASTWTSKGTITVGTKLRSSYWSLDDLLVIADLNSIEVIKTWDGTTFATLTTGLVSPLRAKYAVVFDSRVWLFNITYAGISYPHMILVSAFENINSFNTSTRGGSDIVGGGTFATGLEAFYILSKDLRPINGVELFQNVLTISTLQGGMYQLTGSSAKDYQFTPFNFSAPAIGEDAIRKSGNDVIAVTQGGHIFMLYATQAFGDMFSADLSQWLTETATTITQVDAIVEDTLRQRVLIFIPGKVLVLWKGILAQDRGQILGRPSPWTVYVTNLANAFNVNVATYIQDPADGTWNVFFGDAHGHVYQMQGTGTSDGGTATIPVLRRSRHIGTDLMNPWPWHEENLTGHVRYRRISAQTLQVTFDWDDEYSTCTSAVALRTTTTVPSYYGGPNYYTGSAYYGFAPLTRVASHNIEPGGKGPGFYITLSALITEPFQVDAIECD